MEIPNHKDLCGVDPHTPKDPMQAIKEYKDCNKEYWTAYMEASRVDRSKEGLKETKEANIRAAYFHERKKIAEEWMKENIQDTSDYLACIRTGSNVREIRKGIYAQVDRLDEYIELLQMENDLLRKQLKASTTAKSQE